VNAIPVYDPPIPMGLLKCMQPKRVAHENSEGELPFKVAYFTGIEISIPVK